MVLGDRPLAVHRRQDRGAQQLGKPAQLVLCLGQVDAAPGEDDGPLGAEKQIRRLLDVGRIGTAAVAGDGGVDDLAGDLLGRNVGRQLEQDRGRAPGAEQGEGPSRELGDAVSRVDLRGPLRHRAVRPDGVEEGRHRLATALVCSGKDEHGHRLRVGLGDSGKGVLDPGVVLHRADTDSTPSRRAAVAVRDVDDDPLGARHDRPDLLCGARVDQWRLGKATQELHALELQDAGEERLAGHARNTTVGHSSPVA